MERNERNDKKKIPLGFDENLDPVIESDDEEGDAIVSRRPLGPLTRLPSVKSLVPALLLFILFYLASFHMNRVMSDLLWLSGDSFFARKEYWRLLTALFVHADLQHLFSNAPLFLVFGWLLMDYYGMAVFPAGSLLIGAAANMATIYFYDPGIRLVGASGMVYGMAAQWLVYYVRFDTNFTLGKRIFRATGFSMAMLFPTTVYPNVSYLAHGAGFTMGITVSLLMLPMAAARLKDLQRADTSSE